MDLPSLRSETRYGMPAADQVMFNRHYVLGYSYYFRQAKWALEIVGGDGSEVERADNFRSDYRIPELFRTDLGDYRGAGYDRGHLVASANQRGTDLQNSETFLLSNMSPQKAGFNRGVWKRLEEEVRELNEKEDVLETYVICGPIFYFDQPVEMIGVGDSNEVTIPIPNAYFKSVLAEKRSGAFNMWSFLLKNEKSDALLKSFLVSTKLIEKLAGIKLWERLVGPKIEREKKKVRRRVW